MTISGPLIPSHNASLELNLNRTVPGRAGHNTYSPPPFLPYQNVVYLLPQVKDSSFAALLCLYGPELVC
jgi:hypothetical protein